MKKFFLFFGLGVFSLTNMFGQTQPAAAPVVENKNAPEIVFDKTEYDFGTIPYDSNGTFEFTFKNEGIDPLLVSNAQKSCGCTAVDWTKEPVKKGGKGVIKVTYNTKIQGPFTKNVTVYSNAKKNMVVLTFKGTVSAPPAQQAAAQTTK
jgi:hypothetical protein